MRLPQRSKGEIGEMAGKDSLTGWVEQESNDLLGDFKSRKTLTYAHDSEDYSRTSAGVGNCSDVHLFGGGTTQ
ncbi:hypothetical protein SeMB42_g05925 [Synchytrium endobioticum]|uniref:Uncharacterized protein n=1 Tax=Synchytrium endobioticum TaxID=286115 RepID=A0A507CNB0_9FUNG|nr:hypothetical protein SeMB42_g05925 [Synchytrium endobioticum]